MKSNIGHKLRALREECELTQAEMAHLLGVPDASYSHYERNETPVSYEKMRKLAEALKVPMQELTPESMSFNNQNHHHAGQGGGSIIFGDVYIGDSVANSKLTRENEELKKKLESLEKKLEAVLEKLAKAE